MVSCELSCYFPCLILIVVVVGNAPGVLGKRKSNPAITLSVSPLKPKKRAKRASTTKQSKALRGKSKPQMSDVDSAFESDQEEPPPKHDVVAEPSPNREFVTAKPFFEDDGATVRPPKSVGKPPAVDEVANSPLKLAVAAREEDIELATLKQANLSLQLELEKLRQIAQNPAPKAALALPLSSNSESSKAIVSVEQYFRERLHSKTAIELAEEEAYHHLKARKRAESNARELELASIFLLMARQQQFLKLFFLLLDPCFLLLAV